ncbi:MAG: hypothetical protein HY094_02630 [Candidatus Melainabacteria bacterium]|nr:hypothetical protein [Candidatus Melainabacteria bacterium]
MVSPIVLNQGRVDSLITEVQNATERKKLIVTANDILKRHELVNLNAQDVVGYGLLSKKVLRLYGSFAQNQIENYVSAIKEIERTTGITSIRKHSKEWLDGDKVRISSKIRLGGR